MGFAAARASFPVLERVAYLNAGTFGPLSRATLDAIAAEQRRCGEEGRSGPAYIERMRGLRASVRGEVARLVGVEPGRIALTDSTTDGCNIVLGGLALGPDDEVVTTDGEHFGLLGPLIVSPARIRVAAVGDATGAGAVERLLAEVTPRTRLIAVSHVSWITGHVLDVAALKRETGLPLLVDGAQSVGAIPVDATLADFYTISGQKWLCGPDSTGALYVAEPEALAVARPSYFAQERHDRAAATFEPRAGAERLDSGWLPTPSLAGLVAALEERPDWAFERAAQAAARCRELLVERHEVLTEPGHATLVSFRVESGAAAVAASLSDRGVIVRDLPGTDLVRVSCGWWTSDDDLERLVDALGRDPGAPSNG
jgi:L-cysteine/cystine lyase